jgi:hypothetical protein
MDCPVSFAMFFLCFFSQRQANPGQSKPHLCPRLQPSVDLRTKKIYQQGTINVFMEDWEGEIKMLNC